MPHKHTSPLKGPWCYPERREERRSEEGGERKGEKLRASPPHPHPSKPPTSPSPPHGTLWDSQVTEGRKLKTSRDGCCDRPLPTLSITVTEPWLWSPGGFQAGQRPTKMSACTTESASHHFPETAAVLSDGWDSEAIKAGRRWSTDPTTPHLPPHTSTSPSCRATALLPAW